MKRKLTVIALVFVIVIIGIYISMICDVKNITQDFNTCVKDETLSEELKNSELYKFYNRSRYGYKISDVVTNVNILFALHNFNKGILYVKYDCEVFDNNHNHIYGSWNVYSKWYIEKQNGRWIVTKIEEKP